MSWRGLRRLYNTNVTHKLVNLLQHHSDVLFGPEAVKRYGQFDQDKIFAAETLLDVDQNYTCKRAGFTKCEEYYHWCSSSHFMDGVSLSHRRIQLFLFN
jgi:predicted alpha/beta-fold hydrolase